MQQKLKKLEDLEILKKREKYKQQTKSEVLQTPEKKHDDDDDDLALKEWSIKRKNHLIEYRKANVESPTKRLKFSVDE